MMPRTSGGEIMSERETERGKLTVREAGRRGGQATAERHGAAFYERIGRKGGQRVKDLLDRGREAEKEDPDARG